jgi:hypothetical protein
MPAQARPGPARPPTARTPPPAASSPPVGLGAPRTEQTGKPRVNWAAYDAQLYDGPPEWVLYRCWTRTPIDGRWWVRAWQHLLAFLLGRRCQLLWIGISMRSGIARATEHLADKHWRRKLLIFEIDPDAGDHGPAGARYFTTERAAELYEEARIAAECPRYNQRGNERATNPGATHLTKRIQTRHRADWQQQAGMLALAWIAVSAGCAWLLWPAAVPDATGFTAAASRAQTGITSGIAFGAVLMMSWRILRLAVRGAQPTTGQKAKIAKRVAASR